MSAFYQSYRLLALSSFATLAMGISLARADVTEFQVAKIHLYEQSTSTPPASPAAFIMDSYIDMEPGDAGLVTLNGIGLSEEFPGGWSIASEFATQGALDSAFPGFAFTLHMEGGALGIRHETLNLTSPAVYPGAAALTPTSFQAIQNADSTQDLLIEWIAPDTNTNAVFLSIYDVQNDIDIFDGDLPVGQTSFLISSASLDPDQDYEIEVAFANGSFGTGQPAPGFGVNADSVSGYASVTVLSFHTGPGAPCIDIDRAGVLKIMDFTQTADNTQPAAADRFTYGAFTNLLVDGASVVSLSDGFTEIQLSEYDPGLWDIEDLTTEFATKGELDAQFPSNWTYSMHLEGGTLGVRDQSLMLGADNYPPAPFLNGSAYSDLQDMDPSQELTLSWAPAPGDVTHIFAFIYDVTNDMDVLDVELPVGTTSITIAPDDLQADTAYEAHLGFVVAPPITADDCPGFGAGAELIVGHASASKISFTTQGGASCIADLTGDGLLNFFDVSAFLVAFNTGDPLADFTGDGSFNFFDVSAFLVAFSAGCP
jgi:hypothetical protein